MAILTILSLSFIFTVIFVLFHFLFSYSFSVKKIHFLDIQIFVSFILSNIISFFLIKDSELYKLFLHSFVINLAIYIIYIECFILINKCITISILVIFKKNEKLFYKEIIKNYANGRGARWILIDRLKRLNNLNKFEILHLNKNMKLTRFGRFLAIIFIFVRKIICVKGFGKGYS